MNYHSKSFKRWLLLLVFSLSAFSSLPAQHKQFTYQQVYENSEPEILGRLPVIEGWLDDEYYLQYFADTKTKSSRLMKVNANTSRMYPFIDYQNLNEQYLSGFDLRDAEDKSADYKSFILRKQDELYYFSLTDFILRRLTASQAVEKNPELSPDSRYVAFTRDHDLYIIDVRSGEEKRLTHDGSSVIYNGWAAWVYYEEILGRSSRYQAYWWSPNSEMIAFLHFDETRVPEFPLFDAEGIHGRLELQRYPKAGDPVPLVRLGIVRIKTGDIQWIDFDQTAEHYLAEPFWSADSKFLLGQWFSRSEDLARLYRIDPLSGQKKILYEEKQQNWIEFYTDVYILKNNKGFILRSDRDGWYHLYHYNMEGVLQSQVTNGKWNVESIAHVDEANQQIYFIGTAENPTQKHLYRINLNGKNLLRLTSVPGVHKADISPSARYFIDHFSSIERPSKIDLVRTDGRYIRTIGDQKTAVFNEYEWGRVEIFSIPTDDGFSLPALWILPANLIPDQRYPVIFSVYGGPESASVENKFRSLQDHYLAQQGIITIIVDNRGSGHFGKAGMSMMNRHLGKWEVDDLVTAVKWLRQKSFIDPTRVGITGSSYGGYTTCMALTYGADYFTHGVASLTVTDWRLYDAVYTERYMDKPDENPQGYEFGTVMSHVEKYKGKLLLIHGSLDDNVHCQNILQLATKLQELGRHFEMMIYPGARHGVHGPQHLHENRLIYDFWMKHFFGRGE